MDYRRSKQERGPPERSMKTASLSFKRRAGNRKQRSGLAKIIGGGRGRKDILNLCRRGDSVPIVDNEKNQKTYGGQNNPNGHT